MNGADRATNGTSVGYVSLLATRSGVVGWSCQVTRGREIDAHREQRGGWIASPFETTGANMSSIDATATDARKLNVIKLEKIKISTVGSKD